ncbi:MAG: hypothetical protein ACTSW1_00830 [Candidatus Hodarchaeales archaeon]
MANQIDESFLKEFIKSIQRYPKLREELVNSLGLDEFVQHDEINELLEEIKQLRLESNKKFEKFHEGMNRR